MPDFRSRRFLLDHVRRTMAFYHPRAIDPNGGFYHFWRDDGTNHCYGLAFVLLAYSHALLAGVEEVRAWIGEAFDR